MKKLDYVYFTIYNHYSKQSYFHDSLNVRLKAMYLLALSAGGWILFLQQILLRFIQNAWFSTQGGSFFFAMTIYTAITIIFYRVFIINERDQKIFNRYVDSWQNNPNQKRDLFIASFVAAVPYLSMFAIKLFFPR